MKHNVIHHAFTNVDGIDDDIDIQPWMRMSSTQKKYRMHKYQHLYFWILYSLLYIFWIFVLDYQKYFKSRVGNMPLKKMSLERSPVSSGLLNIPSFPFCWIANLYGRIRVLAHQFSSYLPLVAGFVLSIVFQLAHYSRTYCFPGGECRTLIKLER
jgi:linoleoyl-CoA desaturase